jgi:hypothetical protein
MSLKFSALRSLNPFHSRSSPLQAPVVNRQRTAEPSSPQPLQRAPALPPQPQADARREEAGAAPGNPPLLPPRRKFWRPPTRLTVGLPGLHTQTTGSGMPLPVLKQRAGSAVEPMQRGNKPSKVVIEAEAKTAACVDVLHPLMHRENGRPTSPATVDALASETGLRHEIAALFGTTASARALADRLAGFVPGDAPADARHAPALMLATALRSVGIEDPAYAVRLLDAAGRGESTRELFRLERLLAASAEGTSALGHLRQWPADEATRQMRREALQICSDLEAKGFPVAGHDSLRSVVQALRSRPDARLEEPVGTASDTPLQLLAQALVHCHSTLEGNAQAGRAGAAPPVAYSAYVAWKKGGFLESGPGTDFNRAIGEMHKFLTYADRADHGPRTLGNLARDAGAQIRRIFGVGKSPLTQTRHGTLGGHKDLFHLEIAKWMQRLGDVLGQAGDLLLEETRRAAARGKPGALHDGLAKTAVAQLWRESGGTAINLEALTTRAQQILTDAGIPAADYSEKLLRKSLGQFTRRARGGAGERQVQVGMSTLEALGATLRKANRHAPTGHVHPGAEDAGTAQQEILELRGLPNRTPSQQHRLDELMALRRDNVAALIKELRRDRDGKSEAKPLFKWSDLKALLKGQPRNGPTAEDARQVLRALTSAPWDSMTTFADGASRGVGVAGALAFATALPVGVPLVYPVGQRQTSEAAVVTVGVTNTGGRLFIGKRKASGTSLGVGGGMAFGLPVAATAVAVADRVRYHSVSHGEGVTITSRNDLDGWHEKTPQVVDFLFDQAAAGRGPGAQRGSPAELWARFAQRFGADPHVALSWDRERSEAKGLSHSATVALRGQVSVDTTMGPALTGGYTKEKARYQRAPNGDGADVATDVHIRTKTVKAGITLTQTTPGVPIAQGPLGSWGAAVPLAGVMAEWDIDGLYGNVRIGRTRDGRLSPSVCQWEVLFQDRRRLMEVIELRREILERANVEMDATGRTTPEQAREKVNTILAQIAALPEGHEQLHGDTRTLKPAVAERINRLEARMNTVLGKGDVQASQRTLDAAERAECRRIDNEVHRLLKSADSWQPCSLWSFELDQKSHSTGPNFVVNLVHQEYARAGHLTTLWLAATPPAPAEPAAAG